MCCDSSSSWVCIGIYKPRRRRGCSTEELAARISSISLTTGFVKAAVLKSCISNHVAICSFWEKGTSLDESCKHPKVRHPRKLLDSLRGALFRRSRRDTYIYPVSLPLLQIDAYEKALSTAARAVDVSWYELSCWDCKEKTPSSSLSLPLSLPPLVCGDEKILSSSMPPSSSLPSPLSHSLSCWDSTEKTRLHLPAPAPASSPSTSTSTSTSTSASASASASTSSTSTSSLPSLPQRVDERSSLPLPHSFSLASSLLHSPSSLSSLCLSLGDVVHLRCIEGSQDHLQDVLSYSCLAILKAYFPDTDRLLSYTFYRSLDRSRMAGLGIWQSLDAALAFLNAPGGAREERYWRSLGAKTRLGIYEVAALVAE